MTSLPGSSDSPPSPSRGLWYVDDDTDLSETSGRQPPKKLLFSLTGKCNLRCDHCARGIFDIRATETPASLVDHVIAQVLPNVRSVRLGGTDLGEQLTSRHFDRFLEAILATPPKHLEIVSNLTVLNEKRSDLIARSCDQFGLSLEGVGPAFERIRHFPWSRIEDHIRLLIEARRRIPESRLEVFGLVTCFRDNLDDLLPILDLASLGIRRFEFRLFRPNTPDQTPQMLEHHQREANRVFRQLREKAALLGVEAAVPPDFPQRSLVEPIEPSATGLPIGSQSLWVCHFPFEAVSVYSDGRMSPCCEEIVLGRLDPEAPDILSVFRNDDWSRLRRSLIAGTFEGRCVDCEFRRSRQAEAGLVVRSTTSAPEPKASRSPNS